MIKEDISKEVMDFIYSRGTVIQAIENHTDGVRDYLIMPFIICKKPNGQTFIVTHPEELPDAVVYLLLRNNMANIKF